MKTQMITKNAIFKAGVVMGGLALALQAHAQIVAFQAPVNVSITDPAGFQNGGSPTAPSGTPSGNPFNLALEFTVNPRTAISVTALGSYDTTIGNTGTGFAAPVQVGIYSENNNSLVVPQTQLNAGNSGTVVGSA